ncbi:tauPI-stichotoxin-Hcr2b-like isoform X2 [Montipora foliosa]|uniref:tauPI-stichotoxin-Hcr2b-like isoform X2 n=1 Tax=Montipora foliosa TaxID=591990 RepID=UPI0035F17E3C
MECGAGRKYQDITSQRRCFLFDMKMPELSSISVKMPLLVLILLVAGLSRANSDAETGGLGKDCSSPSEAGPCRAYFRKFFFDTSDKTCKEFGYGGCGGNGNRYDTKEQCQMTCGGFGSDDL